MRTIKYTVPEKKFLDVIAAQAQPTVKTWTMVSCLGSIINGTGPSDRIGNKIFVHYIDFMFECEGVAANFTGTPGAANGVGCRFITWHNREANGSTLTAAAVFAANVWNSLRSTPSAPKAAIKTDDQHQMVVTASSTNPTTGVVTPVNTGPAMMMKKRVYCRQKIDYTSTGGGVADILKHDYGYGFCISDLDSTGALATCTINVRFKVVFSDV